MLKPDAGANLMVLIKKLPDFYRKANKTQIKKLSNINRKKAAEWIKEKGSLYYAFGESGTDEIYKYNIYD